MDTSRLFVRRCIKYILYIFFALSLPLFVNAQNYASHQIEFKIPEVALIGIASEEGPNVSFSPFSGMEAGSTIVVSPGSKNSSMWLNYTSVENGNAHGRKVMAMIQGDIQSGINLKVTPMRNLNSTGENMGQAGAPTLLTNTPIEVISNIGSCYTGKGINKGFNLVYELAIDESKLDFTQLNQQVFTFNVLYTLTD